MIEAAIGNKPDDRFLAQKIIHTQSCCMCIERKFCIIIFQITAIVIAIVIKTSVKYKVVKIFTISKIVIAEYVYVFIPVIKCCSCIGFWINALSITPSKRSIGAKTLIFFHSYINDTCFA